MTQVIGDKQIKAITSCLHEIIREMSDELKSAKDHMNLIDQLDTQVMTLNTLSCQVKKHVEGCNKELVDIKETLEELKNLEAIDANNPESEDGLLLFMKSQSIVENRGIQKIKNSIQSLNHKIKLTLKNTKALFGKNNEEEIKKQEIGTCSVIIEESYVDEKTKLSFSTLVPKTEDFVFKVDDKLIPKTFTELLSKGNEDYVTAKEFAKELVIAEKFCDICKSFNKYALMLNCHCVICMNCLQNYVRKNNNMLLDNALEAKEKGSYAMCLCRKHQLPIDISILCQVFGSKVIEQASINALKRQIDSSKDRNRLYLTICPGCNKLLSKAIEGMEVVDKLRKCRVCTECYK